jgi:chlorophyllide a oxygenase
VRCQRTRAWGTASKHDEAGASVAAAPLLEPEQQQQLQQQQQQSPPPPPLGVDPEAVLRRYGSWFGRVFKLPAWLDEAPRVRVRTIARRQMDDLVELAVLNERLSGAHDPWEARNRLELLRTRRRNWQHVFEYVTSQEAAATLDLIEQANAQVRWP